MCPAFFGPFPPDAGCATSADCLDPSTTCQNGECQTNTCSVGAYPCDASGQADGTCIGSQGGPGGGDVCIGCSPGRANHCLQGGGASQYCCSTADRSTPQLLCPAAQICVAPLGSNLGTCLTPCSTYAFGGAAYLPCPSAAAACVPIPCEDSLKQIQQAGACYPQPPGVSCGLGAPPVEFIQCAKGACPCPMFCAFPGDPGGVEAICLSPCEADGGCAEAGEAGMARSVRPWGRRRMRAVAAEPCPTHPRSAYLSASRPAKRWPTAQPKA